MNIPDWAWDLMFERIGVAQYDYAGLPKEAKDLMTLEDYVNSRLNAMPPITWSMSTLRYQL